MTILVHESIHCPRLQCYSLPLLVLDYRETTSMIILAANRNPQSSRRRKGEHHEDDKSSFVQSFNTCHVSIRFLASTSTIHAYIYIFTLPICLFVFLLEIHDPSLHHHPNHLISKTECSSHLLIRMWVSERKFPVFSGETLRSHIIKSP